MAKIYNYADSLSETHFFYAFPKENRLFFLQNLITKKWDAHYRASHFLYFMKEVYFFQVTDLQPLNASSLTVTLSSALSITISRFSQFLNAQ